MSPHDNLQAASRLVDEAYNLVESIKDPRLSIMLKNLAKDQAGLDVLAAFLEEEARHSNEDEDEGLREASYYEDEDEINE